MANVVQLVCIFSLLVGVELFCLDGWTRRQDSCYYIEDLVTKTWHDALLYCESVNAHLVRIESKAENDFIKHELTRLHTGVEEQYWTAGNDITTEGHWVWGNTSDSIELTFWHPGEPNHSGDEDCMTFYMKLSFDWNDEHCNKHMFYICEMEDPMSEIVG